MLKNLAIHLSQKEQWNISDDEDEVIRTEVQMFPSKFIKQLNFQQNCQQIRQRRIKKINQVFQLRGSILENLKNVKQKEKTMKAIQKPSIQNVKEIYYKGSIIKGRLKKRLLHGDTQILYENGAQFKGVFKNGKMQTGKFDFKNGYEYLGQLEGTTFIGKGTLRCPNGAVITGVWNGDQIVGRAEIEYKTGDVYYGELNNFKKHGEGYLFFKSGSKYIGHFQDGSITGYGAYSQRDGTTMKGYWKNGELIQQSQAQMNSQVNSSNGVEKDPQNKNLEATNASGPKNSAKSDAEDAEDVSDSQSSVSATQSGTQQGQPSF